VLKQQLLVSERTFDADAPKMSDQPAEQSPNRKNYEYPGNHRKRLTTNEPRHTKMQQQPDALREPEGVLGSSLLGSMDFINSLLTIKLKTNSADTNGEIQQSTKKINMDAAAETRAEKLRRNVNCHDERNHPIKDDGDNVLITPKDKLKQDRRKPKQRQSPKGHGENLRHLRVKIW
jgi:hypothetical protein